MLKLAAGERWRVLPAGAGTWLSMGNPPAQYHLILSTERLDRVKKLPAYARHGVGPAWLVTPATRTLEVYRRDGTSWLLAATFADDAIVRAEPFDAVEIDLLRLWGEERPTQAG